MLEKLYFWLLKLLPAALFFSFFPLLALGASDSMNFELSIPLLWLIVFDVISLVLLIQNRVDPRPSLQKWQWWLFPIFCTVSVCWSLNQVRGLLTVVILWLLYFAVFAFFRLSQKIQFPQGFKASFWRWFFGASLLVCLWCWLQSFWDLAGGPREATLMCAGCVTAMFGFPHPSGFAIEPQFMGNLLLAPTLFAAYFAFSRRKCLFIFFALAATLFLTFSRGAIYAFLLGFVILMATQIIHRRPGAALSSWLVLALAFLFTLNAQGMMAEASFTSDTYGSGVTKAIHQLSLGTIDLRSAVPLENTTTPSTEITADSLESPAVFDGYVESSTNARLGLTTQALEVWRQNPVTVLFGVGLGGAGQALYQHGLSPSPKEIIQNQYASLLLETGLVGYLLAIWTLVLCCRVISKSPLKQPLIALLASYALTLLFFSGLPNALHIYLIPPLILLISRLDTITKTPKITKITKAAPPSNL